MAGSTRGLAHPQAKPLTPAQRARALASTLNAPAQANYQRQNQLLDMALGLSQARSSGGGSGGGGGGGGAPDIPTWQEDPANLMLQAKQNILQQQGRKVDIKALKKNLQTIHKLQGNAKKLTASQLNTIASQLVQSGLVYGKDIRDLNSDATARGAITSSGFGENLTTRTGMWTEEQKQSHEQTIQAQIDGRNRLLELAEQRTNTKSSIKQAKLDIEAIKVQAGMAQAQRDYAARTRAMASAGGGGGGGGGSANGYSDISSLLVYQSKKGNLNQTYQESNLKTAAQVNKLIPGASFKGYAGKRPGPG